MATKLKHDAPLGRRIVAAREDRNLKQYELAEKAGIGQGHLSQIEAGDKVPTLATLKKLRDALGLKDLEWTSWVDAA